MELSNERELANTRRKLRRLEACYEANQAESGHDEARDAETESLERTISQLREEIARYEARQPARQDSKSTPS